MLSASASTLLMPRASTCDGRSLAPTAAAMTACAVRMPSSPPKTIVFTRSPPLW